MSKKSTKAPKPRFWTQAQNNSGGIFDHYAAKGVGYAICVEALDSEDAANRLSRIIDSYPASYDCPCCGDRWSLWMYPENGNPKPELYGKPLRGGCGIPSYVHYLDGRIEEIATQEA
jgi:hypothetical protein